MKLPDRNANILEHILTYCGQIEQTVERLGSSYEIFASDPIYRNAAALCILQIGELVGKLTDEFRMSHPSIPWRQIKAMRNIVAHNYGSVDPETTWEIIVDDIPKLKAFCLSILNNELSSEQISAKLTTSTEDIAAGRICSQEDLDLRMKGRFANGQHTTPDALEQDR